MITLELTYEEAIALRAITQCVAGHPDWTARRLIDGIAEQLEDKGISIGMTDFPYFETKGSVQFVDNS